MPDAPSALPGPVADQGALARPPVGLSGSNVSGGATMLSGPFALAADRSAVPAPLLAPALPIAEQMPTGRVTTVAGPAHPTYDVLPGLLAGLLVGVGFLGSLRIVQRQVAPHFPARPDAGG